MKILITAGPTREPIDPVRYIGNRSSGQMGAALADASLRAGYETTLILGPVSIPMPARVRRIDVETAAQMLDAVLREFPNHDLLIMAAAVADYRPKSVAKEKLGRHGTLTIECEATKDISAAANRMKRPDQRIVGYSLENDGAIDRARQKLHRKGLDLIVYNPVATMNAASIDSHLIYPDGRDEKLGSRSKAAFADILLERAVALFSA